MTKQILLTQGQVALVDEADYEWLMRWKWYYADGYAVRNTSGLLGKRKLIYMHREIMQAPADVQVDHVCTEEKLNNTRENLRYCSNTQNSQNRARATNNTSGYKGVSWHKVSGKWQANIKNHGAALYLGLFEKVEEAARAYDAKARELYGEFARTNF